MARPLRLEYGRAVYHLTARGNARQDIFPDDQDRSAFLNLPAKEVGRQRWLCYAHCPMFNHYHLLIETPEPNPSRGMRRLNGVHTQIFNRGHCGESATCFRGATKAFSLTGKHACSSRAVMSP